MLTSASAGFLAVFFGAPESLVAIAALGALLVFLAVLLTLADRKWRVRFRTLYRSSAYDAGGQGRTVLSHVANAMRPKGEPYGDVARLLETYVLSATERALTHFGARVQATVPRFDTHEAFIDFWRWYQLQSQWMKDAGRLCSYNWEDDGNYRLWMQADKVFLGDVKELMDRTSDEGLRKAIRSESWPQGGQREYW